MRQAVIELIQDRDVKAVFAAALVSGGSWLVAVNSGLTTLVLVGTLIVTWRKVFKPTKEDKE